MKTELPSNKILTGKENNSSSNINFVLLLKLLLYLSASIMHSVFDIKGWEN